MVCRILFFDCSENDKLFFKKNNFPNYEIITFKNSLNRKYVKSLSPDDLEQTVALSVFTPSLLSAEVINEFPNLRVISTRSKSFKHIDVPSCVERNIAVVNIDFADKLKDHHLLQASIKAITGVFCGEKENRVV